MYATTEMSIYQVELAGDQCSSYSVCSLCMRDPYCGWNLRKNTCEDATKATSSGATGANNVVPLNPGLCARLERQENIKSVQLEAGSFAVLECQLGSSYHSYLYPHVEWRRDQRLIDFASVNSANMFLTWNKGKLMSKLTIKERKKELSFTFHALF